MTDKIIWNNLRNGDKDSLENIYRRYFSDLYNYGKRFSTDLTIVEDCIQELFLELWNKKENLSETDSIKPYLFVSLRRKIIQSVKKVRKSTDVELTETHFVAELAIDQIMINNEIDEDQKKKLNEAFQQLPDRQKEILYLKYYANMDYEAISEIMELNYQSARNLVSRGIAKLSQLMITEILLFMILSNFLK